MQLILNKELFEENHHMCVQNDKYIAPAIDLKHGDVIKYIEDTFPAVELPSLFGLHENAELSYQKSESQNIISYVQEMMPSDQGGESGLTV